MNITIIGTGYVGLTLGACLAEVGNNVICVDKDIDKIHNLNNGIISIYEPELPEIIKHNQDENRLNFSVDLENAVKFSDICFITVGTPAKSDGNTDLSYIEEAAEQVAKAMNGYKIIVNKSTSPVGTADKISEIIRNYTAYPFDVAVNPEFLRQGNAVRDFLCPDRIIIGTNNADTATIIEKIYIPIIKDKSKIIHMDIKSAEITKYASNCFLATKISLINEFANLCEKTGANIKKVEEGLGADTRIGNEFLNAGLGYGGSCFPKDIKALIKTAENYSCNMNILKSVDNTNQKQRQIFLNKIYNKFGKDLNGKMFALLGLSFKPNTDDLREAPSITIINDLLKSGAKIKAYDPKANNNAKKIFNNKIILSENLYNVFDNSDAILLLTEWEEFKHLDFDKVKTLMKSPIIFDGRNIYNAERLREISFECYQLGM